MADCIQTVRERSGSRNWAHEPKHPADSAPQETYPMAGLRAGDAQAFEELLAGLSPSMLGLATSILSDREMAEEVVQDTWLAAIQGLERFEGRSSLKTWIFSILTNVARTRARRERRTVPFSSLGDDEISADKLAMAAERLSDDRPAWTSPVRRGRETPEDRLLSREAVSVVQGALRQIPSRQAEVVTLRDVKGWSAAEVREELGLTEANQKVLLHRGRVRVRCAVEEYRKTAPPQQPLEPTDYQSNPAYQAHEMIQLSGA